MATKPQSTTEEKLEPCPFCGASAFISWDGDVNSPDDWSANCDNTLDCGATVGGMCSEDVARKAWNTRLSPASAAPVVDNLQRRLYEECVTANWDPERKNTFAEEIAHLHEELSEAFRAWRKYKDCNIREVNGKLEGVPIEFADALIGMFYNAELHGFDLLAAVERKHQFNLARNYVEEGRQLHASATADTDEILRQMRDVPAAATAAPQQSDKENG